MCSAVVITLAKTRKNVDIFGKHTLLIVIPLFKPPSCRDGLAEPPQSSRSKKRASSQSPLKVSLLASTSVSSKSERQLKQLEAIHARTNVSQSLQLSDGQRIKVDSPNLKRKAKPRPDFHLELSDLKDPNTQLLPLDVLDLENDDEDLPISVVDLQSKDKTRTTLLSPERSYSDSEMDALIAAIPLKEDLSVDFRRGQSPLSSLKRLRKEPIVYPNKRPSKVRLLAKPNIELWTSFRESFVQKALYLTHHRTI